ncbi:hypothetical protein FOVSG1_007920 [Fusarium oxysporum f. sp. vasinfectum]
MVCFMVYGLGKVATILNLSLRAPGVAPVDCLSRRENLVINSCTDITVSFWYAISSSAYSEYTAVKLRLRLPNNIIIFYHIEVTYNRPTDRRDRGRQS